MANTTDKQTPFYEIKVYAFDSYGNTRDAKLTQEIKRLIDKVTITDAATSTINKGVSSLEITFKETAYLPQDSGLRGTNADVQGQITNRPGAILDLRFRSEKGFTFVSKEEVETGKVSKKTSKGIVKEPLIYLFQSGNLIEVTWGYLEPYEARTLTFEIKAIKLSGGGSGDGNVTLTAIPPGLKSATKNKVSKAVTFLDPKNTKQTVPLSLKQVVWKVAQANQLDLVFDGKSVSMKELPKRGLQYDISLSSGDSAPANNVPFRLPRDSTSYDFLTGLAEMYQAVVEIRQIRDDEPELILKLQGDNKVTSTMFRNVLFFTPYKKIYDVVNVGRTLTYRDIGGTILSYNIDDINGSRLRGSTTSALTDDTLKENSKKTEVQLVVLSEKIEVKDPIDYSLELSFETHLGVSPAGKSVTTPDGGADSRDQMAGRATANNSFPIRISLNTIGDITLKNETIKVSNIGTRYSGTYDIFSIVHNVGNHGFTNTLQGRSQYVAQGGIKVEDIVKEEQEKSTKAQLVTPSPKA